jgi:hypothetical protein
MHRRIATTIALLALSAVVVLPAGATAAGRSRTPKLVKPPTAGVVIKNCTRSRTGLLTRPFSARVLRVTRKKIRSDVAEYTNCFDALRAGLRRAKSKIVVGIRKRSGGRYVAGQVVLRDARGRVVDARVVRAGKRTSFLVPRGRYKLQDGTLRGCTRSIAIRPRKTVTTAVVCSAA